MRVCVWGSLCLCMYIGSAGGVNTTFPEITKEQSTPFKPRESGACGSPSFSSAEVGGCVLWKC